MSAAQLGRVADTSAANVPEQSGRFHHWTLFNRTLIEHTKALDPTRPVTYVTSSNYGRDKGVSVDLRPTWA